MDVTLAEAARLLGMSVRQVRYMIQNGRLPSRKVGGRVMVDRADLPLSDGQQRAATVKQERAAELVEQVLRRPADAPGAARYSVRQLRAFQEGMPIHGELVSVAGADHAATVLLRECLSLLACGCHEYRGRDKAAWYIRAREQASRAVAAMWIDGRSELAELAEKVEGTVVPAIGGLIRRAEKRGPG